jgi:hypothetical protein
VQFAIFVLAHDFANLLLSLGLLHFLAFSGLAVLAACLKALAVGAPFAPGLRIFSPDPSAILLRFAAILL